ncbi:MAG: 16S rRNA (guanine(966)-N(2))-methyltransferase RsmD [Gammaproteobacteria bacterium]|nr:16S rRNA (guanine(966)-N(2))-methyltransferase RsmD [Gammaproteobacteria bacterium]
MTKQRNRKGESASGGQRNQVRIIGGLHRGRRLGFPDQPGLRPTADRVRETLFNWLQPSLPGAVCLDLFAGSGALGFEAASRGAGQVVMLDSAPRVAAQIADNIRLLGLSQTQVHCADALTWLSGAAQPFDIIFLDPPFATDLLPRCCRLLSDRGWLRPGARIYIETDAAGDSFDLPTDWRPLREKRAGNVSYRLFTCC